MNKVFFPVYEKSEPGNYRIALARGREALAATDPQKAAVNSGSSFDPVKKQFTLTSLGHEFLISHPGGEVRLAGTSLEPHFIFQIMMVNYLSRADGTPLSYNYIPYRQLEGGNVFFNAFKKTAIDPLAGYFGDNPALLLKAGRPFGAVPYSRGSGEGILLYVFPRLPVLFMVWPRDSEFPAGANILFDDTANHYMHTEDLAAMDVVARLLIKTASSS